MEQLSLSPFPAWLTAQPVDDARMAAAYAAVDAPRRSCLKNGLALHYALWGESPLRRVRTEDAAHGFCTMQERRPVPWALCCVGSDYEAPARCTAALMPALLAGVRHVALVGVDGEPTPAVCLAAELMGVEDVFTASLAQLDSLWPVLPAGGRVVLLHRGALTVAHAGLRRAGVIFEEDAAAPLLVRTGEADADLLAWAQGQEGVPLAEATASGAMVDGVLVDAVFGVSEPQVHAPDTPVLLWGPGMEGCWLHPRITPDFFSATRVYAGICEGDV